MTKDFHSDSAEVIVPTCPKSRRPTHRWPKSPGVMRLPGRSGLFTSARYAQPFVWAVSALIIGSWIVASGESIRADTTAGAEAGWLSEVQRAIAASEYNITWQTSTRFESLDAAWHAPNRAHGFRTYFTEQGVHVIPRVERPRSWQWNLSWVGYGRGGTSWQVPEGILSPHGNCIDYQRGDLLEWYENSSRGLKQGFVLHAAPAEVAEEWGAAAIENWEGVPGRGRSVQASSLVHVDLALEGNLSPVISRDGQVIDFVTSTGEPVVRYAELRVEDARGESIQAWMEGFAEEGVRGIRLVLDASEAVWPLTIDPLSTNAAWSVHQLVPESEFGKSVATAGDINGDGFSDVIIGAPLFDTAVANSGKVFLYLGSTTGLSLEPSWTAQAFPTHSSYFGDSVSTAGDVNGDGYADVIVGASGGLNEGGRGDAYVFLGSASGLAANPAWHQSGVGDHEFGRSVSTAGDVNGDGYSDVVVGAPGYDNGENEEGRVLVYTGSASGLGTAPAWTAEGNQPESTLGLSVAAAGDVNGDGYADVIVGAPGGDSSRVLVFHGSASGLGTNPAWSAETELSSDSYGASVSTAGDVNGDGYADVVIGVIDYSLLHFGEGRAVTYHGSASGLEATAAWMTENIEGFGGSSTAGDVNGDGYADVIVGAPWYDTMVPNDGRAFVYLGSAYGLGTNPSWEMWGFHEDFNFGTVATAGDVNGDGYADVIVGEPGYAYPFDPTHDDHGRALVFHGGPSTLAEESEWIAEGSQESANLGWSVSTAGDVNGDGFADVIIGAPHYDSGELYEGRVLLYHGSDVGLTWSPAWTAEGNQHEAEFGWSVSEAGDVNGDGYSDVIIGAPGYTNGQSFEGGAFVYHGSSTGLQASPAWTAESDQDSARLGLSVSTAGDVNGDGYADVIIGAPLCDNGETNEGRVFVHQGSVSGLSTNPDWTAESDHPYAEFGESVSTAGDVNADGFSDVIVDAGTYFNPESGLFEGRAYVYHGSASGLDMNSAWMEEGTGDFGRSVSTAGDVNGDGYADVIVGAPRYDDVYTNEGRVFVYHGSATGLDESPTWTSDGGGLWAEYGSSVGSAGDVNGDGFADIVVGAPWFAGGGFSGGLVVVYHGSASGLGAWTWLADGVQPGATFGASVANAGDVNGDGYSDVIIGAPYHETNVLQGGRASVYYGNGGRGMSLVPKQWRTDDAGPVAHLGSSDSPDGFRLSLLGRTPFGRSQVRLEWEVKQTGQPFDGFGTQSGIYLSDTGTSGVQLNQRIADLPEAIPYHWRVRLRYDPIATPYAQIGRWLTIPWKGWQETMLRTPGGSSAAGMILGAPLRLSKVAGGIDIALSWDDSCLATDTDYAIYEGEIGSYYSHRARFCTTGGATTKTFAPLTGNSYYLVVPLSSSHEGSYGIDGDNVERMVGQVLCLPQQIADCR